MQQYKKTNHTKGVLTEKMIYIIGRKSIVKTKLLTTQHNQLFHSYLTLSHNTHPPMGLSLLRHHIILTSIPRADKAETGRRLLPESGPKRKK